MSGTAIPAFAPAPPFLRVIIDLERVSSVANMNWTKGMASSEFHLKDALTVVANRRKPFLLLRKA
jgi:hypothetical protein